MKRIPRKCIGQNGKKQKNNVGYCLLYRTIQVMTGKSHTKQDTTQNEDFSQMLNDNFAGWQFPFFIVGLER
jgi:hypothetical protein